MEEDEDEHLTTSQARIDDFDSLTLLCETSVDEFDHFSLEIERFFEDNTCSILSPFIL